MAREILLDSYLKKLAAKTPTPGGGSAAALTAALGAALISMAAKYILKRALGRSVCKRVIAISSSSEKALERLELLMNEDEKAYLRLATEIKKRRPKNILGLYKDAVGVPLKVCGITAGLMRGSAELCRYSKTSIISDVAEAALLLEAAFLSAKLNVEINLRSIGSADYKNKIRSALRRDERNMLKAKKRVRIIC